MYRASGALLVCLLGGALPFVNLYRVQYALAAAIDAIQPVARRLKSRGITPAGQEFLLAPGDYCFQLLKTQAIPSELLVILNGRLHVTRIIVQHGVILLCFLLSTRGPFRIRS